jgi:hypothetical protein
MAIVLGYLRYYSRWDGSPGMTIKEQQALVTWIARKLDSAVRRHFTGRSYHMEETDGASEGWPVLKHLIKRASEDFVPDMEKPHTILVIPTLDGVRFSNSFLEALVAAGDAAICIYSGRPPAKNEMPRFRSKRNFWELIDGDHRSAFKEKVKVIQRRNQTLPRAIKTGLREAAERGEPIGSQCRGTHRFTGAERSKGGRVTGAKRQSDAEKHYAQWHDDIWRWRVNGDSPGKITRQLAAKGARKPDGNKIGQMTVRRIINGLVERKE